jgi:hypothetical protein
MRKLFVGFTVRARGDAEKYLPESKAPVNYKDPAKIVEYERAARARSIEDAAEKPLTGELASVAFLSDDGKAVESKDHPLIVSGRYDLLIGCRVYDFVRLARIDYIDRHGQLNADTLWSVLSDIGAPLMEPSARIRFLDPVRALVGSSAEENTNPVQVANRFDLTASGSTEAERLAALARQVSLKLGIK